MTRTANTSKTAATSVNSQRAGRRIGVDGTTRRAGGSARSTREEAGLALRPDRAAACWTTLARSNARLAWSRTVAPGRPDCHLALFTRLRRNLRSRYHTRRDARAVTPTIFHTNSQVMPG